MTPTDCTLENITTIFVIRNGFNRALLSPFHNIKSVEILVSGMQSAGVEFGEPAPTREDVTQTKGPYCRQPNSRLASFFLGCPLPYPSFSQVCITGLRFA